MTGRTSKQVQMVRCDATHRAKERYTHLTHVCIEDFQRNFERAIRVLDSSTA